MLASIIYSHDVFYQGFGYRYQIYDQKIMDVGGIHCGTKQNKNMINKNPLERIS